MACLFLPTKTTRLSLSTFAAKHLAPQLGLHEEVPTLQAEAFLSVKLTKRSFYYCKVKPDSDETMHVNLMVLYPAWFSLGNNQVPNLDSGLCPLLLSRLPPKDWVPRVGLPPDLSLLTSLWP